MFERSKVEVEGSISFLPQCDVDVLSKQLNPDKTSERSMLLELQG